MWRLLLCLCILVPVLVATSACASKTASSTQVLEESEFVTDFDEPERRKRARIRFELAIGYFELGQTTVALDEVKQVIATDPSYSEAHNLKGLIYMRLNDFRLAESSFKKTLEIDSKDASAMHNLGWLMCRQARYPDSDLYFFKALSNPKYQQRAKTLRTQGLCQINAGLLTQGGESLFKSYEIDAVNPITAYNLALVRFQQNDFAQAQLYIRRLNNSELANAESLWLGIKTEYRMNNPDGMTQLATQLLKRFPTAKEVDEYHGGNFDE
jgi:type IV pilus assembly protein PilF